MTRKDKQAKEIAALKRELAEVKAAIAPKPAYSGPSTAEWENEMHQLRERNASRVPGWLQRECAGGVTDADARDIAAARHAPQTPSIAGIPSSQPLTGVRPGGGSGWTREVPLSPPPGIHMVDALCIADDVKQRAGKKP
jgi:hypothetical protein